MECIFCQIIAGTIPSTRLYEDGKSLVFMDINPATKGHCLVVPKRHAATLFDLDADEAGHLMQVSKRIATAVRDALKCDGLNLFQSNGRVAFQTVDHFHLHVIPRYS